MVTVCILTGLFNKYTTYIKIFVVETKLYKRLKHIGWLKNQTINYTTIKYKDKTYTYSKIVTQYCNM